MTIKKPSSWLMILYDVPSQPSRLKVRVWREFKTIGALYPQLSICLVPDNNNNQERIQRLILSENWLLDNETGKLEGVAIKNFTESTDTRLTLFADNINKAINAT